MLQNKFWFSLILILILSVISHQSSAGEERIVRGNIVCIEIEAEDSVRVLEEFTECSGLVYILGVDDKLYSLHGSEEEMKKISAGSKTRMGYRLPLRLKGNEAGHQRAWALYTPSLEPQENEGSAEIKLTGTVLCLLPNYRTGT